MNGKVFVIALLVCLAFWGYGMNLYKLTQLDFEPSYKAEVLRVFGLVPFFGSVIGFITFEEER